MLNNPLTFTDPSGFFLKKLARTVKKIWKNDVVQAAVTIATAVYGGPVAAAAYVGEKTAIDTGSISRGIKAGLITYGTAQAFQWAGDIGEAYGSATVRYAAHAAVGCVSSVANHGECGAGAVTSVMALAATGNLKPNRVYFNTAVHAVVGGTASVIAGGKFANGAVTGSFGYLFNYCAHNGCFDRPFGLRGAIDQWRNGAGGTVTDVNASEINLRGAGYTKIREGLYLVHTSLTTETGLVYGTLAAEVNSNGFLSFRPDFYDFDQKILSAAAGVKEFSRLAIRNAETYIGRVINGDVVPYRIEFSGAVPAPSELLK